MTLLKKVLGLFRRKNQSNLLRHRFVYARTSEGMSQGLGKMVLPEGFMNPSDPVVLFDAKTGKKINHTGMVVFGQTDIDQLRSRDPEEVKAVMENIPHNRIHIKR